MVGTPEVWWDSLVQGTEADTSTGPGLGCQLPEQKASEQGHPHMLVFHLLSGPLSHRQELTDRHT